ncbi:MAG TPA: cytochrome c oxidase subunit II [Longimicrobiales bacterium]|nr:cytochrome c oxidase subunit II [Longimicrobiales bacterium]
MDRDAASTPRALVIRRGRTAGPAGAPRRRAAGARAPALVASAAGALVACAGAPASTLSTAGAPGTAETWAGWLVLGVAAAVVVIVTALVLVAALRRRGEPALVPPTGTGLPWVVIGGIVVPAIVLTVIFVATTLTLAAVSAPPRGADTIQVLAHRWWWEVQYPGGAPAERVTTANEVHVAAGRPVKLVLSSGDVVHSFWVPRLAGKTDVIPGQRNVTWIEAKRPGVYYGRCGEYCGAQHANMQLRLVADAPADFARWLAAQRQPAAAALSAAADSGRQVFMRVGCANCHTIRGTPARGVLGPDLTHLMSRGTIAGGTLPNTPGNRAAWVVDAQGIKPGALMPSMPLPPPELRVLLAYLETLR